MKRSLFHFALFILIALGLFLTASCNVVTEKPRDDYLNAGNENLSVAATEFDPSTQFRHQFTLYRFNTSSTGHTLTLPGAATIVANLTSPYIGELIVFGVTADGSNPVTLVGGANVTIKPSAQTVPGNTTLTMYCVLDNVTKGSEAVTIY